MYFNKTVLIRICQWLLIGCIIGSIYMRITLFHIGYEYDELFTAITTDPAFSLKWIYRHWLLVDVHPPLYNVLLWIWNHFVPYGPEIWLRLPSFLMGVGALLCAWMGFPKRFGRIARLLFIVFFSCNLYAIAYSQHARSYMLVLLLAVPLTFLFVNISNKVVRNFAVCRREWIGFAGLSVLLCWSHYFGALLFGAFAVVLLVQTIYYKRNLKYFMLVPAVVLTLFLPWLIPNFIAQLEFHRLSGNWWANQAPYWHSLLTLMIYWTGSFKGAIVMGSLLLIMVLERKIIHTQKILFWRKEQIALGLVLGIFILCVALISIKIYMFINRYFVVLLPVVYLMLALFFAPLFRRRVIVGLGIVVFVLCELENFWAQHTDYLTRGDLKMPARMVSQMYRDRFPGKAMFVVAMEAFPPVTMPALYGFYVNQIYHLDIPVYELFSLEEKERNALLNSQEEGVMWMPNCTEEKLQKLSLKWKNRSIYVTEQIGLVCFLEIGPEKS